MNALIQSIGSFLNLPKLTAITVPGMVIAFALVLVLGPIPCRDTSKSCPYCPDTLKPVTGVEKGEQPKGPTAASKVGNTVITSEATWLSSSASTAPQARTALLSKFEGLVPPPLVKSKPLSDLLETLPNSCGKMPLYVVPSSRPPSDKSNSATKDGGKNKAGTPQYTGETTRSVEDVLSVADDCYASLTRIDQALQSITATMQTDISQDTTDLTSLSTALVNAQTNANQLAERDLSSKIAQKKADLQANHKDLKSLSLADSYVTTLLGQVTAIRKAVSDQATPAAAAKETAENIVTDVFETIQQNFLKFLLFALIIGAIFDPIQRGLLSFVGPRRNVFQVFNRVYGQRGDGEIRYGDRRLPPWTHKGTFLPRFELLDKAQDALPEKDKQERLSLRYSPADFAYRKDMNVYDQNYAIGAGFITQSEFDGIYNEFFTQCQITTGLILPLLILSVCIGIRLVCCGAASGARPGWWKLITGVFGPMYFGLLIGWALTIFISYLGSGEYGKAVHEFFQSLKRKGGKSEEGTESGNATKGKSDASDSKKQELKKDPDEGDSSGDRDRARRKRALWIIWVVSTVLAVLSIWASQDVLGWDVRPFILLPCVFLFPLWFAGLDRLHKYYSELQARIAGNIRKQNDSMEQKIMDLISDPTSCQNTVDQFRQKLKLVRWLGKLKRKCKDKECPCPTKAPSTSAVPSPPPTTSAPSSDQAADSQLTPGENT
jgi:hypothetical protein